MTTANEFRDRILTKASEDDDFRTRLLDDPAGAIGDELNVTMPEELTVQVHSDGPNVVNLVLPPKMELDVSQLENVAGGNQVDDEYPGDWTIWD